MSSNKVGTERLSFGWDEEVCVLVEMGFTASQASHALNVCGGNTKDAYDFLSSSNELVSSSRGGTQAAALFDFDSTKPRQVFDENVDGQVDYSSSTLNMTRPPQSNATPGAFRVGDSNSVAGTVIVGTPHQDVQNVQTGSIAPVEAEIVEDDLQERRELEAQLQRVLEERENAPVAQVVDTSNWWTKRRNRLCAERENAPIAQVQSTISSSRECHLSRKHNTKMLVSVRKDIRRLYVLVCAALVLVLVGIIVAVSLSLTLGKQSAPAPANDSNNTAPTPTSILTPSPSPGQQHRNRYQWPSDHPCGWRPQHPLAPKQGPSDMDRCTQVPHVQWESSCLIRPLKLFRPSEKIRRRHSSTRKKSTRRASARGKSASSSSQSWTI